MATRTRTAPAINTRGKIVLGEFDVRAYYEEILTHSNRKTGKKKSTHRLQMDEAVQMMRDNPTLSSFTFECTDLKLSNASTIMYTSIKTVFGVTKTPDTPLRVHCNNARNILSVYRGTPSRLKPTAAALVAIDRKMISFDSDAMHYTGSC